MSHIQKILVPMDGSPASIAALAQAVRLAESLDAAVEVLHVNAADALETDDELEQAIIAAKSKLGERLSWRTESGDPITKILDAAEDERAGLIVMGTHGRVGRIHALMGSVAESIVRNAPCPVVTVRAPGAVDESFSERVHRRPGIARPTH